MMTTLDKVLEGLMNRYQKRVPDVETIIQAMIEKKMIGSATNIENDHIAFRTLGVPHLGIASLEKIFLHLGYTRRDAYTFTKKKLLAYWYQPPHPKYPRVFISQLLIEQLSQPIQTILKTYTNTLSNDPVDTLNLDDAKAIDTFLHSPLWKAPTWEDYEAILQETEYGAWALFNKYYLNHFTISIHRLPAPVNTLQKFNQFLETLGIVLNDSNGIIKKSADGLLLQSASVAEKLSESFLHLDGRTKTHILPGSYVEFAERLVDPKSGQRRDGFDAGNADTIFESTYTDQTHKK